MTTDDDPISGRQPRNPDEMEESVNSDDLTTLFHSLSKRTYPSMDPLSEFHFPFIVLSVSSELTETTINRGLHR
jgi:hypothetical protein